MRPPARAMPSKLCFGCPRTQRWSREAPTRPGYAQQTLRLLPFKQKWSRGAPTRPGYAQHILLFSNAEVVS